MMTRIALLITTDGRRDYLERSLPSAIAALAGAPITDVVIHDDSGDPSYRRFAENVARAALIVFGRSGDDFEPEIIGPATRGGHPEAIRRSWARLAELDVDFVFHLEDDFIFPGPIPWEPMLELLDARPELAQVALKRQPWYPGEIRAGGIVERNPEAYEEKNGGSGAWLEHRMWFTLNPCFYRLELCRRAYPDGHHHEWKLSKQLEAEGRTFALWGRASDPPATVHIGERKGGG